MKKYKKGISALLIVVLLMTFNFCFVVNAENQTNIKIIEALRGTESIKDEMGLTDVDYGKIKIASPIYTYECKDTGLIENTKMYPLLNDEELIAWAIEFKNEGNLAYQITTALVAEVTEVISVNTRFAIIYDKDGCYLYDGANVYLLKEITTQFDNRIAVQVDELTNYNNVQLNAIENGNLLGYTEPIQPRAQVYYSCNVSTVSQLPYTNLCWAASAACIVNYLNGTSLTAAKVARTYFDRSSGFNQSLTLGYQDNVLAEYGVSYTYKSSIPSDAVILKNIQKGYPIQATFKVTGGGHHDVVIYGTHITAGYINIMDPEYGKCSTSTTNSSNAYVFVSGYSGATLTLFTATCKYTTA